MTLKVFRVVLMASDVSPIAIFVPAIDADSAREYVQGNGDIVAVDDVSDSYEFNADDLSNTLRKAGYDKVHTDVITRLVSMLENCVD